MKQIIFTVVSIFILHISYGQKIQLLTADTAFKVIIGKADSTTKNSVYKLKLCFQLTGSSKDSLKISLKTISADFPSLIAKIDKEITITKGDWPDSNKISNTVEKIIEIEVKPVEHYYGEDKIQIKLDLDGPNKDKIVGGDVTRVLVHFNESGLKDLSSKIGSSKIDSSNVLKTDFSFYTDFLGVDNERPNGLYQVELGFKVPINKNKTIKLSNDSKRNSFLQLFRSFYFNMNLMNLDNLLINDVTKSSAKPITRIDSTTQFGIDTVITTNTNTSSNDTAFSPIYAQKKLINAFDLYQWASFSAKLKFNLIALRLNNHHIYFGYNAAFLRTPIYDSIAGKRIHATSIMHGPELFYETEFKVGLPFNIRLIADYYWLKLWNNDLEQINAPVFKYNDQSRYRDYFENNKQAKIFDASFRIAYIYNKDSTSNGNQVFMRVSNSFQSPIVKGVRFHNNFTQVQFGGVFDLNTILRKAKSPPTGENNDTQESDGSATQQ